MNKLSIFLLILICTACSPDGKDDISLYKVKKGDLSISLTEEGELKASNSINISSPAISWRFGNLKIIKIIDDGTEVTKGDTVMIFDPSEVGKAIEQSNNELDIAKAELEKNKAEQASKLEELESNFKITEISHRISEINFELAEYEAEITKKEIELKLKKAKISLGKAKGEILNTKKIQHEELQQSLLKIKQLEAKVIEATDALKSLTIISPAPGIAIITKNWSTNNKWQVGDQTWSGNPMISLPDLSQIISTVKINEIDISKIRSSQMVEIKLDAYSDTIFSAQVTKIANLAESKNGKDKIKVFPIETLIDGTSPKLLPGMTVSCKIMIDEIKDELLIPVDALYSEKNQHWVYLKSGSSFKKTNVDIGASNSDFVIIKEGLKEGDQLALSDPFPENESKNKQDEL
jgi:multidrug efflux pump subunit AcrA (membrane-fusion protein)